MSIKIATKNVIYFLSIKGIMTVFEKNIVQLWGSEGKDWLKSLPTLVTKLANQWGLENLAPIEDLTYNYVLKGFQGSLPIVLKIGFDSGAIMQEYRALQAYNGSGCINVLAKNSEYSALLLERAVPGDTLKLFFPGDDKSAVIITANIMKYLHAAPIPRDYNFPTIKNWLSLLQNPNPALYSKHIDRARDLAEQLLATQGDSVLLHGDLHHENILSNGTDWIAIDPKGVIGEPAYEVGAFIRNPVSELLKRAKAQEIMQTRIHMFSEIMQIDKQRMQNWSYVQAVLAACWAMEDGQKDPAQALAEADLLYSYV